MTVIPIGSSSAGNAILLEHGGHTLLLDCGLPWAQIRRACGYKTPDVVCISHEHGDHARGYRGAINAGAVVMMTTGTAHAIGATWFVSVSGVEHRYWAGWEIRAFATTHDGAAEPCGFVIAAGNDVAVYVCDAPHVHPRFAGVTHWLLEANYDAALLEPGIDESHRRHVVQGHMSIDACLRLLAANDLSRAREIWLLHMSDRHSDEAEFARRVQAATGVPTFAAPRRMR